MQLSFYQLGYNNNNNNNNNDNDNDNNNDNNNNNNLIISIARATLRRYSQQKNMTHYMYTNIKKPRLNYNIDTCI